MGLHCPSAFRREQQKILPIFNMIVVGFKDSGKSSIVRKLGIKSLQTEGLQSTSPTKPQLGISSFVLEEKVKVMSFQVRSPVVRSWKNYYPNANILLLVIDMKGLRIQKNEYIKGLHDILTDVDNHVSQYCKVIVVFNKIDQMQGERPAGQTKIVKIISELKHQVATIKCSASTGEGIDKLSKDILAIHKTIDL